MFRLNLHFKAPGQDPNNIQLEKIYEYYPQKKKQLRVKVEQMNSHIAILEKSLKESEEKANQYKNIILKYDSVLHEEINLYRLQKSKIETIKDAYNSNEIFMQDIKNQLCSLIELSSQNQESPPKISPLKRIFVRFFHQKELNQKFTDEKLLEIEQVINEKQQLLDSFYTELKTANNPPLISASKKNHQSESMN